MASQHAARRTVKSSADQGDARRSRVAPSTEVRGRPGASEAPALAPSVLAAPYLAVPSGEAARVTLVRQLQRTLGNRATTQAIQRAIGFEFETAWSTFEVTGKRLTSGQKAGQQPIPPGKLKPLAKKDVVVGGKGFKVEADERARAADGSDMEFITAPFDETKSGRAQLEQAMTKIQKICERLSSSKQTYIEDRDLSSFGGRGAKPAVIQKGAAIDAAPQATGGIRLDQIHSLMKDTGAAKDDTGANVVESAEDKERRAFGRTVLMGMNIGDRAIVGQAAAMAASGVQKYRTAMAANLDHVPIWFGSAQLKGLVSLVISYLLKGNQQIGDYAKTIAPLMARTDFGTIYKLLPKEEQTYLASQDGNGDVRFVKLVLLAAGMPGTEGTPVFSRGIDLGETGVDGVPIINHGLDFLTRGIWLTEMTKGRDLMTAELFPAAQSMVEKTGVLSLGSMKGVTERVGKPSMAADAPIFEFRRMSKGIGYDAWIGIALDVFDYLVALNEGPDVPGEPAPTMGDANYVRAAAAQRAKSRRNNR